MSLDYVVISQKSTGEMIAWYGSEQDAVAAAEKSVGDANGVHSATICKAVKSVSMKSKAVWEDKVDKNLHNVTRLNEQR